MTLDPWGMNDEEQNLAAVLYRALQRMMNDSERSQQVELGPSDIGTCQERARRTILGMPMVDEPDKLEAFIGTAVGDYVEKAIHAIYPDVLIQQTVTTTIANESFSARLLGHADLVFPWGVADVKSVDGIETVKRDGPTQQQLFQRHIYTKAAFEDGLLELDNLNDARTANIWIDRSGQAKELFVHMDDYNPQTVVQAADWLEEVYYCVEHDQVARKDPPRTWCAKACGYFQDCRQFDTDVEGLITDESVRSSVRQHAEGGELVRMGKQLQEEAKKALAGVSGFTEDFQIRWVHVNATGPTMTKGRRAHDRLNITPLVP